LGGALLVNTIPDFVAGKIIPQPQPAEGATYARKIKKEDGRLDWTLSAEALWNRVRGLAPWPGTFTHLQQKPAPVLVKVLRAEVADASSAQRAAGEVIFADRHGILVACGEGALRILELQREGGKRLAAAQFLAGFPLNAGDKLQ
jgi:methionyl-tRNA formyltransferase